MVLEVKGHKDILFTFRSQEIRDDAMKRINAAAKEAKEKATSKHSSLSPAPDAVSTLLASSTMAATAPLASSPEPATPTSSTATSATEQLASVSRILERSATRIIPTELLAHIPRPINIPADKQYHIQKQHFVCLTIGSRGDVQPYIALCLGLKKEGHEVTIVTHEEYKAWVEGFGIQHRTAGGDPGALMKLSVEHKFRKWLDELLVDSFDQVKAAGATVLIESPSAMAGVHIAEALNIPYFRAFTMPWSRTAEYPHAFISPPDFVAGSFNFSTYVLFDNVFWRATAPQINPWRKKHLGLPSTDLEHLAQTKIPFLYNFSQHVVPKPLDWSDTTIITGYWFLDNPDLGWKPSQSLLDFMAKARADGKPLVYIGFGSIVVENPKAMTRSIVKAVLKTGIPTLIKPWFGDQFFWAARVQKLGAGLRVPSLSSSDLAHALTKATSDRVIREKAQAVGEKVRSENGVATAIQSLYMYLHRAGIRPEHKRSKSSATSVTSQQQQQQQQGSGCSLQQLVGHRQPTEYSFMEVASDATPSMKQRPLQAFSYDGGK
ncbi:hypothetical protein FRC01_011050 [Tulasnella sp. 417]|nr:hypothetical protein FRC01_011050 [Tulasnella sp. 417]